MLSDPESYLMDEARVQIDMLLNDWSYKRAPTSTVLRAEDLSILRTSLEIQKPPDGHGDPKAEWTWLQQAMRALHANGRNAESHYPLTWNADPTLLEVVYLVVRTMKPQTVVETGVANGLTTWSLLEALQRNGVGRLYSIDPCYLERRGGKTGQAVPPSLTPRWTLIRASSRRGLKRLLRQIQPPEVFLHDSLHTYRNMICELREYIRQSDPGTARVVIADDVEAHSAFSDAFDGTGWSVSYIPHRTKPGLVGLASSNNG